MERFVPREVMQQTDNQTCLPTCLLMYYSWLYPERELDFKSLEKELHGSSFGIHPEYYVLSHATAFTRRFPDVDLTLIVDSPTFATYIAEQNTEEKVVVQQQPITVSWIREATREVPLLVYVDAFYIGYPVHMPHFLYLFQDEDGQLHTIDPGYGNVVSVTDETLDQAIEGLKYHLLWSLIGINLRKRAMEKRTFYSSIICNLVLGC